MENEELHLDENNLFTELESEENISSSNTTFGKIQVQFGLGDIYIANEASVEFLHLALESSEWQMRTEAARKLGKVGGQEAVGKLVDLLEHDEIAAVQAASARALSQLHSLIAEKPLVAALDHDNDDVRITAAEALGGLGEHVSKATVDALVDSFLSELNEYVRVAIISALGNLGEKAPIHVLETALEDPEWIVREAAARAMGKQNNRVPEEALIAVLDDESEFVCKAAIRALGSIQQKKSEQVLQVSREEGAEDEIGLNNKKGTSGSRGQGTLGTVFVADTPASKQEKDGIHQKNGNVEFLGIDSGYFAGTDVIPIVAQALDNQWIPGSLLKSMLKGKITYREAENYLEGLVRTEYIRALVNGERVIINRAYLYNNPALFRDYLADQASRATFKGLLDEGSIIPFLLYEHSPNETPAFETNMQGFSAWEEICQEVRMQCMRFSWDDETQQTVLREFTNHFHNFIQQVEAKDPAKYLKDLHLDDSQLHPFAERLSQVTDLGSRYFREHRFEKSPFITRNVLYKQFVTAGDNPSLRLYDGTKPFAGEIKQLIDLAYNSQLADALNGYLLTPIDSPNRLILQDWESSVKSKPSVDGPTLFQMLRNSAFALFQEGRYLKSMGLLTLQDVHRVRQTEEWRNYIKSLQTLLKTPIFFSDLADVVHRNYVELMSVTTALIEQRDKQRGGSLMAPWEPSVKVLATVGHASLSVIWNKDGTFYNFDGEVGQTPSSVAPLSIKLTIGGNSSSSSNAQADLFSSIDIMQQKMLDAQRQWKDIMLQLRSDLMFKEYSRERVKDIATPTINEQA